MRLRYIELKNFLGHEDEKVALPDSGMFFLAGESGAGKSSFIVDAVGYALFGSKATRVQKQEQLRHKDHQGEPMEVRALFEFDDGSQLTVARGLSAKGVPWAEAFEPDQGTVGQSLLLADTANRVGRIVRKRMGGMTWQQFYAAFVARQSEIAMLTTLKGTARKELVHRLLGMRELEKATEEVAGRLRSVRTQLKGLQSQLGERTRDTEDARVQELREESERLQKLADEGKSALESSRTRLQAAESELEPYEQREAAYAEAERLRASLSSHDAVLVELNRSAVRHAAAQEMSANVDALHSAAEACSERYEALRGEYARSAAHIKQSVELAAVSERIETLQASLVPVAVGAAGASELAEETSAEALRTRRHVLGAELDRIRAERSERQPELERLRETGECFTCLRPLGEPHDHERVLASIEEKLSSLEQAETEAVSELGEIEAELPRAQQRERELERTQRELAGAEAQLEQLVRACGELEAEGPIASELEELKAEGVIAAAKLADAQRQLAAAQAARAGVDPELPQRISQLQELIASETAALAEAEALAGDNFDSAALADRRKSAAELRRQVSAGEGQVPELFTHAQTALAALASAERDREALLDKLGKLEETQRQTLRLEDLQTYLGGFQRKLASDIRPALEEIGSEMLNQVSDGKHVCMRIDDSYEIEVQTAEGSWLPAALLSGGESIRVNICLRLALTRLVSQRTGTPMRTLVFDEPLPSQDPGHVQRIMDLLDSLRSFFPQQFVISHVGSLRTNDTVDYVLDFEGSGSNRIALSYA